MNYLAHLFLAEPTPASLLGNLIADFVKGNAVAALPPAIQEGVRMHRRIDGFTDRHPIVQRSITRISKKWGWFSGILIDVWYDHILATTWDHWSSEPLRAFVDRVQAACTEQLDGIPVESRVMIERLIESDRLFTYQTVAGIEDSLTHLSRRIRERIPKRPVELQEALPDLRAEHAGLAGDFREFFPSLIAFAKERNDRA